MQFRSYKVMFHFNLGIKEKILICFAITDNVSIELKILHVRIRNRCVDRFVATAAVPYFTWYTERVNGSSTIRY